MDSSNRLCHQGLSEYSYRLCAGCKTSAGVDIDTAAKSVRKQSGFATLHTHPCEKKTGCQPDEGNLKAKLSNAALCYVVTEGEKVQLKLNNHLKRM